MVAGDLFCCLGGVGLRGSGWHGEESDECRRNYSLENMLLGLSRSTTTLNPTLRVDSFHTVGGLYSSFTILQYL